MLPHFGSLNRFDLIGKAECSSSGSVQHFLLLGSVSSDMRMSVNILVSLVVRVSISPTNFVTVEQVVILS